MNKDKLRAQIENAMGGLGACCLDDAEDRERVVQQLTKKLPVGIDTWVEDIFRLSIEKGWWRDAMSAGSMGLPDTDMVKDLVSEKLNLIHDEVSEASSEARQDRWDTYWVLSGTLPMWDLPGNVLTLSLLHDVVKAAYDDSEAAMKLLGSLRRYLGLDTEVLDDEYEEPPMQETLGEFVEALCKKHKPEGFGIELIDNIIRTIDLLRALNYNIEELLEMKHTYNATRPYRHGNKRY